MKATVRVAPLLNPSNPSAGLITPVTTRLTTISMAIRSTVSHSVTKRTTAPSATNKVIVVAVTLRGHGYKEWGAQR